MKRTIILTTQRTGSSFLCRYLNNHPSVYMYTEVFLQNSPAHSAFRHFYINNCGSAKKYSLLTNRLFRHFGINLIPQKSIEDYLNSLVFNQEHSAPFPKIGKGQQHYVKNKDAKLVGFKLMYGQLRLFPSIKDWIISNQVSVIHLMRKNQLHSFISKERARQAGVTHKYKDKAHTSPIYFDFNRFSRYASNVVNDREHYGKLFRTSTPYMELYYEDFFSEMDRETTRIQEFLGLEIIDIASPDLRKIGTSSLQKEISNHEEARLKIQASKYAPMLEGFE